MLEIEGNLLVCRLVDAWVMQILVVEVAKIQDQAQKALEMIADFHVDFLANQMLPKIKKIRIF